MEAEGFKILGNSGDQWSDLLGSPMATRSFKLPNPMYFISWIYWWKCGGNSCTFGRAFLPSFGPTLNCFHCFHCEDFISHHSRSRNKFEFISKHAAGGESIESAHWWFVNTDPFPYCGKDLWFCKLWSHSNCLHSWHLFSKLKKMCFQSSFWIWAHSDIYVALFSNWCF